MSPETFWFCKRHSNYIEKKRIGVGLKYLRKEQFIQT